MTKYTFLVAKSWVMTQKKKALILGKPGKTNHRVLDKENKYCYALISYQKYVPLLT